MLCWDEKGYFMNSFSVIRVIAKDFEFLYVKFIVEFWDCGGLY